ncbi:MAG: adenylosuccinate lyase [Ardenticatenales bacterium]|nr:adenylosuccinate lyase [Ardenticatenales bacterium]
MATPENYTHDSYLSPFTWRYGSEPMRRIWSESHKRRLWRRIWVALAEAQEEAGLVSAEQVADLRKHMDKINIARAHEIEVEIQHDLMAEVHTFAEQAKVGGAIIHLGATSMDIEDNAEALRLRDAMDLLLGKTERLLGHLAEQVRRWAATPTMAFTHLQPAEPTTVGYRLAQTAQDLAVDLEQLRHLQSQLRGKGFKGAVGTSASYEQLLSDSPLSARDLEQRIMERLSLEAFEVTTQTYPRKQEWLIANALAGIAGTLYKFAFDLRLLQSPPLGEWSEPFGSKQIGSSAMPFKRNPINAEKIDSLARYVSTLPNVLWHNAAHSLLERTLDDSANRRVVLPELFLATDELLRVGTRLVRDLQINEEAIQRTLTTYGPFAATERLLMEAVKAGADRQHFHELIRRHALAAWAAIGAGHGNPLMALLTTDPQVTQHIPAERARQLLDASGYVGDAPARAQALAGAVTQSRWGCALLVGERLYVARRNLLFATHTTTGQEEVHEQVRGGNIERLILAPGGDGLILHFAPSYEWRGISNVLRLTLDGAEEWRAEMRPEVRPWGYQSISSDGESLRATAFTLREGVELDWETGRVK